jgi:hypothetical protein
VKLIKHSRQDKPATWEIVIDGHSLLVSKVTILSRNRLTREIVFHGSRCPDSEGFLKAFAPLLSTPDKASWQALLLAAVANVEIVND